MKPITLTVLLGLSLAACSSSPSTQQVQTTETTPSASVSDAPQASPIAQSQAARRGTVTADSLNVRQSADATSPVLYRLPAGTSVEILGETARGDSVWYQVRPSSSQSPQTIGWAFSQYIRTDSGLAPDRPPTTPPSNGQAYQDGYRLGYRDGENFKKYNAGYNPDAALQAGSGNPDPNYDRAFREGFYAGFDAGYYGRPYNATPSNSSQNPNPVPPSEPN